MILLVITGMLVLLAGMDHDSCLLVGLGMLLIIGGCG